PAGAAVEYQPRLLGFAEVTFVIDKRAGREHREAVRLLARPAAAGHPTAWDRAEPLADALADGPLPSAAWEGVPEGVDTGRKLKALEKAFAAHLAGTQKLSLYENRTLGLVSEPGEALPSFRARCREAAAAQKEQALRLEKAKFQPKFEALGMKVPGDEE